MLNHFSVSGMSHIASHFDLIINGGRGGVVSFLLTFTIRKQAKKFE